MMEGSFMNSPIFTGTWGNCHIQGIAVDKTNGYIYYSFTTKLIKATLDGNLIGSIDGLVGHLGCIAFNEADGCVYGSLEYKNDTIGKGILKTIDSDLNFSDGFYVVRFDVAKIDRFNIPAENSDIMTAIYLKEVTDDYRGAGFDKNGNTIPHKYGCSGIDGLTFAPLAGKPEDDGLYLYVAYGIYSDVNRNDNDHQILLCYDLSNWDALAQPLIQKNMHQSGPSVPFHKFFVYTGNTRYGVQNLEYDCFTKSIFMAVYKGCKPNFPNFSLFAVDMEAPAKKKTLSITSEAVETLRLRPFGTYDQASGIYGWDFPFGTTGLYSFGNSKWLISHNKSTPDGQCSYIYPYVWNGTTPFVCEIPVLE